MPCPGAAGRRRGPGHGDRETRGVGGHLGSPRSHHLLLCSERGGCREEHDLAARTTGRAAGLEWSPYEGRAGDTS